jgi:hypothetical protein
MVAIIVVFLTLSIGTAMYVILVRNHTVKINGLGTTNSATTAPTPTPTPSPAPAAATVPAMAASADAAETGTGMQERVDPTISINPTFVGALHLEVMEEGGV